MPTIPQHHEWVALIVDDQRDNLTVASLGLELHGVQSHTCISGHEALELLKTLTPTFILCDIDMPHMNGYQFFDAVRADNKFDNMPILAITAGLVSGNNQQILDHGFNGLILKPFDIMNMDKEIEAHLKTFLDKREKLAAAKIKETPTEPTLSMQENQISEEIATEPTLPLPENQVSQAKPSVSTASESEQLSDTI